jgi:mannan endo-1,6-alpha-mannosidase
MKLSLSTLAASAALLGLSEAQQPYTIDSKDAIKKTASMAAWNLLQYYKGNETGQTPGILPGPPPSGLGDYYWWQGGAMWATLIDYWFLTGDETYNDITHQGLIFQFGEKYDFMPENYTISMGNDDQGFWAMTAMTAAETNFKNPPKDKPSYITMVMTVFKQWASPKRWQTDTCGGGLRWQVPWTNEGYEYKNTIANGCFFNVAARLAVYTGDDQYAKWAEKIWDWIQDVGFMGTDNEALYDGATVNENCTEIHKEEYSYNNAVFTLGAAHMYNFTNGSEKWKMRLDKLLNHGEKTFFPDDRGNVAYEPQCETSKTCNTDMKSFKGYLHRWYATATKKAPYIKDTVLPMLEKSAQAAVKVCTGGKRGNQCGFSWAAGKFDGLTGAGQEMNVVAAVSSLLIDDVKPPLTRKTGGTSVGDPNAGDENRDGLKELKKITPADRAGGGILTVVLVGGILSLFGWMSIGDG